MEWIDLTGALCALIALLGAVAVRRVLPWVEAKTTAEERENLLRWVEIAVGAAQQLYHQSQGSKRLEYALELLESKGFNVDDRAVRDAVEAAVLKLHEELNHGN